MAKAEHSFTGDFDAVLAALEKHVLEGSISASLEEQSDYRIDDVRCAVRVFERYSWTGANRVSLSVTLLGQQNRLYLSAITSGGSQALFVKINTLGEEAFLDSIREFLCAYGASEEK